LDGKEWTTLNLSVSGALPKKEKKTISSTVDALLHILNPIWMGKRTILNLSVSDALSKRGKNLLVLLLMHPMI
jgi:hypothetical protein